ncbi:helix-turn-helix domain-containing protein [Mycobacterium sp. 852002-10029_SCH5224772]|uniref:AlbA family DNA-binding domain-containing protein n=1 Tax=Mycobacterium sp. 852002-10029_SCH5224772 TaxID=1834083 RepID=UPI001E540436|nr:ATP-binding protein [Mycobacterium sp. 852002-10029_SCH5224772]
MEAKLADRKFSGVPHTIDPHHLTTARNRLLAARVIERHVETTRGGQSVSTYLLSDPTKVAQRAAGRKRLLHARFLSWSNSVNEWGAAPVPAALERVVHASLMDAAPGGYIPLRPEGGEVAMIAGAPVPGGRMDNAAFYSGLGPGGLPQSPVLVTIEVKNLRQWIYPQTQELYQLLFKSAMLRMANPELVVFPVLVCRKAHYTTRRMAQHLGFHVITTERQYVRPAVAATEVDRRKFDEVNSELVYNLTLNESAVPQMVNHFTKVIPGRSREASSRWSAFVSHPDVPRLITLLRDDSISNEERTEFMMSWSTRLKTCSARRRSGEPRRVHNADRDRQMTAPGWPPRTEEQLRAAAANGILNESHKLDLKRELVRSESSNRDIAKDIAAFSLDGGIVIIGVDEGTSAVSLYPVDLAGLAERIEQIAATRVDEPAMVTTTVIDSTEFGKGYVVVEIPVSPRAPLMADGKYYGRGDKTNRVLSHAEVLRLHEQRLAVQHNILADARTELAAIFDAYPEESREMMLLIADPLGARENLLEPLSEHDGSHRVALELVRAASKVERQQFSPSLFESTTVVRRPGGLAVTTGMHSGRFAGTGSAAEAVFNETGRLTLASNRTILEDRRGQGSVFEELIIGHTDLLVRLSAVVSERFEFSGSWRIGLIVNGLRGAGSHARSLQIMADYGEPYAADTYERAVTASGAELKQSPESVVRALVSRLLRSLGSQQWLKL